VNGLFTDIGWADVCSSPGRVTASGPEADGSHKLRPTEAGSEAGSKFHDCCRIRSAPFDYRVKAPDEDRPPRSMNHAAIKEIAMPRELIVSIQQGE